MKAIIKMLRQKEMGFDVPASRRLALGAAIVVVLLLLMPARGEGAILTIEQRGDSLVVQTVVGGRAQSRAVEPMTGMPAIETALEQATVTMTPEVIARGEETIPWGRVTMTTSVRLARRGWRLVFDTLSADRTESDDVCGAGPAFKITETDFIFGSVFFYGGEVEIYGEVGGDVVCLGGPIRLHPGAVVRGSVLAIGGRVFQEAPAKVYGGVYSNLDYQYRPVSVSRRWEFEGDRYGVWPTFTYDKVDGARPGIRGFFQDSWLTPKIGAWIGYSFSSEIVQYQVSISQRLAKSRDFRLDGEFHRFTDTEDRTWVGSLENTLVALLANEDYRDYYGSRGGSITVIYELAARQYGSLSYRNFDYRLRTAKEDLWSLFWSGREFRENFGMFEGPAALLLNKDVFERKMSLLRLSYRLEPPGHDRYLPGIAYEARGYAEIGGGLLGGDWDFSRIVGQGSLWYDFAGRHRLLFQVRGGLAQNDVPAPKFFFLGGPASLRGYRVKQFYGDEMLLFTTEYSIRFWKHALTDASFVLFYDFGRVTLNSEFGEFWEIDQFRSDIGVALDLGGGFRLAVAKALELSDLGPVVTVRVKAGL